MAGLKFIVIRGDIKFNIGLGLIKLKRAVGSWQRPF